MRIPVCRGEFGLKIRYHVPWVHALPGPKIVQIEEGEEALYPSADAYEIVPRVKDDSRRGLPGWKVPPGAPLKRFVPSPHIHQLEHSSETHRYRVVICPRKRQYGSGKNWEHWDFLAKTLPGVFSAGAPDSSYWVPGPRAWDYPRFLDASIEAMLLADLVIATDAGLAHLAILCGRPLLLITYRGLVAPGPVMDPQGRVMEKEYWPVRLQKYYIEANHQKARIVVLNDGWEDPSRVLQKAEELLP